MTSAEARNADATVAEFREQLRECAANALLAGIHRDDVKASLRELLELLESGGEIGFALDWLVNR